VERRRREKIRRLTPPHRPMEPGEYIGATARGSRGWRGRAREVEERIRLFLEMEPGEREAAIYRSLRAARAAWVRWARHYERLASELEERGEYAAAFEARVRARRLWDMAGIARALMEELRRYGLDGYVLRRAIEAAMRRRPRVEFPELEQLEGRTGEYLRAVAQFVAKSLYTRERGMQDYGVIVCDPGLLEVVKREFGAYVFRVYAYREEREVREWHSPQHGVFRARAVHKRVGVMRGRDLDFKAILDWATAATGGSIEFKCVDGLAVRIAFLGGAPLPERVPARRRIITRGGAVYRGTFESLRVLGCHATGLCVVELVGPAPAEPEPPMWLDRAGWLAETVQYDHDSLYSRVAVDLLRGRVPGVYPAVPGAARAAAARVEEMIGYRVRASRDAFIVVSEETGFAELRVAGRGRVGSGSCRRWYEAHARDPPLSYDEAVEVLRGAPCRAYAVRLRDALKFSVLAAIGYSKRTTGLWRYVVGWARRVVLGAAEWLAERGVELARGYVDSYQLVGGRPGREPPQWKRYPVKREGYGDGVVVLPATYRAGDSYGFWGVHLEDGDPPEVPVASGPGGTVWARPREWYRRAAAVLRGEAPPRHSCKALVETAARHMVRVECGSRLGVRDLSPGARRWWRAPDPRVQVLGVDYR